jgi:L-ascorbate metabolism protein UlaG (beta-lactamase superfamily)
VDGKELHLSLGFQTNEMMGLAGVLSGRRFYFAGDTSLTVYLAEHFNDIIVVSLLSKQCC